MITKLVESAYVVYDRNTPQGEGFLANVKLRSDSLKINRQQPHSLFF